MVAYVVKVVLGPDTGWEAERLGDIFNALLKAYKDKGYHYATFLAAYETGEYQGIMYWDSEEQANLAVQELFPLLRRMVQHQCQWPPSIELFQVYHPKPIHLTL